MRRPRGFTYTELLCVLAIIAVGWMLILPAVTRAREAADAADCALRLRHIGFALRMYADDNYGHLPPNLEAAVSRYLQDGQVLRCPTVLTWERRWRGTVDPAPPGSTDYLYAPGLSIDDLPRQVVAWDSAPRHHGAANMLNLQGDVQRVKAKPSVRAGGER
jgi:prepilin-type N-terminal cleavage/methylation domain-containing protein